MKVLEVETRPASLRVGSDVILDRAALHIDELALHFELAHRVRDNSFEARLTLLSPCCATRMRAPGDDTGVAMCSNCRARYTRDVALDHLHKYLFPGLPPGSDDWPESKKIGNRNVRGAVNRQSFSFLRLIVSEWANWAVPNPLVAELVSSLTHEYITSEVERHSKLAQS